MATIRERKNKDNSKSFNVMIQKKKRIRKQKIRHVQCVSAAQSMGVQ